MTVFNETGKVDQPLSFILESDDVIDYDRLTLANPRMVRDLPAVGKRIDQRTSGYAATLVSGQIIRRNDLATAALPRQLIRGSRLAPS